MYTLCAGAAGIVLLMKWKWTIGVSEWVSEWVSEQLLFHTKLAICSAMSCREKVNFHCDDDEVHFVVDQHA